MADDLDVVVARHLHGLWVDEVNGYAGAGVADEAGGRIDLQRGTDDDKNVGLSGNVGRWYEVGHSFAKPYNPRTEQRTVGGKFTVSHAQMVGRQGADAGRVVGVGRGAYLHQFTMQVNDVRRTGAFVKVVDILRHHRYVEMLFELGQQFVSPVGPRRYELFAQAVVKIGDQIRVGLPAFGGGYLFNGILFPKSAGIAKGAESAFGTHAGTCKYYEFLHACMFLVVGQVFSRKQILTHLQKYNYF